MKPEEKAGYGIGYGCGTVVFKLIPFVFKILWNGIIKMSIKYVPVAFVYIALVIGTVLLYFLGGDYTIGIFIFLCFVVAMNIFDYIKDTHYRQRRKYFNQVFQKAGLVLENHIPYFLNEELASDFIIRFTFETVIPLHQWQSKKEVLEMHFNVKISSIEQDHKNLRNILVYVQREGLPNYIEWQNEYMNEYDSVFTLGVSSLGLVTMDLRKFAHSFVAGETGSGKSNILKCLIQQAILKDYDIILIDFKRGVSFSSFNDYLDIYYDYVSALKVLKGLVLEVNNRLDKFRENHVDNIDDYNSVSGSYLQRKVVFIDELAELLKTRDKELSNTLTDCIETLTRLSRATGIHLIMGIQRPDSTIISGQIKNNVSFRICGRFVDREPSRIMLGDTSASNLPNIKGRFIVRGDSIQEFQSFYFDTVNVSYNILSHQQKETESSNELDNETDFNYVPKRSQKKEDIEEIPVVEPKAQKEQSKVTSHLHFDFSDIKK